MTALSPTRHAAVFIVLVSLASQSLHADDPAMMRKDATQPSTLPAAVTDGLMGKLSIVCPRGVLSEMRHGSELFMLIRNGRVQAVESEKIEPQGADKVLRLVTAGVDVLPDPNLDSAGDVFPIADGTVSDVLTDDTEHEYRGLGYCVIVRHSEKLLGRETYSLYSHLKEEPKVNVGDTVTAGRTPLGQAPDGDPGLGRRLHVEIRFFRDRYYTKWKAPSGVRGRNFMPRDFERDFLDPQHFFALLHPDVPALVASLKDKEPAVRQDAAVCLGLIGLQAKEARDALTETTKDSQSEVADAAAIALVRTYGDGPDAAKDVAGLLKNPSDFVRGAAARELGEFGADAKAVAVPALIAALEDADHGVRAYAAGTIERFAPEAKEAIPPLRAVLREDKFPEALFASARALSAFGPEAREAVGEVLAALPKLEGTFRVELIRCIPAFGPEAKSALPALRELAKDQDGQVRAAAEEALKQISP